MHAARMMAALIISSVLAGCANPQSPSCYNDGMGMMIGVEVDPATTPAGERAPTAANAYLLVLRMSDRSVAASGETDSHGCAAFDQGGAMDLPAGRYEIEASINKGSCDWWASSTVDYDGQAVEVPLRLECHQVN